MRTNFTLTKSHCVVINGFCSGSFRRFFFNTNAQYKWVVLVVVILFFNDLQAQYWKSTGALAATGSSTYLIGATHAAGKIYVLSREQNIAYSENLGVSWTKPSIARPGGDFVAITGIKDRLYASLKLNTYDHNLYYSTNNGVSWQLDNDGLPQSLTNTGKSAMILKDMGDDYVLAHNYQKAVYKKLTETTWQSTFIDFAIVDIAATTDKWLAIGAGKILQSTDKGKTWTTINTTGLPAGFQGSLITSNGSRIFVSNAPANGGEDIYFSDDGGLSWTKTNSGGKFSYANPWLKCIYAVENYVFSSVSPKFGDIQNAPPFVISSTQQPNFSIGNTTGLPTGQTNTNLPFFFHVKNKLFTMFWDLYSSEPGFSGIPTATKTLLENRDEFSFYPNPARSELHISSRNEVKLLNANGTFIRSLTQSVEDISDLAPGFYILVSERGTAKKLVKQ